MLLTVLNQTFRIVSLRGDGIHGVVKALGGHGAESLPFGKRWYRISTT